MERDAFLFSMIRLHFKKEVLKHSADINRTKTSTARPRRTAPMDQDPAYMYTRHLGPLSLNGGFLTSSPQSLTVLSTPPDASHNPPLIVLCYLIVCPLYTPRHLILSLTFSPLPLPGQPARHGVNAIRRSLRPTYLAVKHTRECSRQRRSV